MRRISYIPAVEATKVTKDNVCEIDFKQILSSIKMHSIFVRLILFQNLSSSGWRRWSSGRRREEASTGFGSQTN